MGPLFLIEVRALFWRVDLQKWRCFLRCFLWMGWKDVTPKSLSGWWTHYALWMGAGHQLPTPWKYSHRYQKWCIVQDILPETNIAPVNGWLEDDPFLFGVLCLFSGGELFVLREIFSPFKLWLFRVLDIKKTSGGRLQLQRWYFSTYSLRFEGVFLTWTIPARQQLF